MKAIAKKVDQLGRVHLPREIRQQQGIEPEMMVVLKPVKDGVLIQRASD